MTSVAFGRTVAGFAKRSSSVRGSELMGRSAPTDMTPHETSAKATIASEDRAKQILPAIRSYGQHFDRVSPAREGHYSYAALIFPKS
ncbi:hypothetical protein G9U53_31375 [Rhodococcus sp. D-46]|uniref:hypothetical protein n=1 Tax=unclassified Rhodococcus (in: high G+C Gram-positive bacteria) TaxID=192944 RepID=UPI0006BA2A07|nr:hypothetical protein [Rhodococcus sp. ADH]KPH21408.1 hypothetical protein AN948_01880 [Rhodococcus sp. ADH]NHE68816.1 hypothetical protein [Rhodococcus sp. D-46]RGP47371.1 hypothetical protein AWH04_08550 [Rhodococcus erythropolis]